MNLEQFSDEMKAVYLACAIDTEGWISLRYHKHGSGHRIGASVGITNQNVEFLKTIATIAEVPLRMGINQQTGKDNRGIITRKPVFQLYWSSPKDIVVILQKALPYLIIKKARAEAVLEYCKGRVVTKQKGLRGSIPYTVKDFELVKFVLKENNRSKKIQEMETAA